MKGRQMGIRATDRDRSNKCGHMKLMSTNSTSEMNIFPTSFSSTPWSLQEHFFYNRVTCHVFSLAFCCFPVCHNNSSGHIVLPRYLFQCHVFFNFKIGELVTNLWIVSYCMFHDFIPSIQLPTYFNNSTYDGSIFHMLFSSNCRNA